eukprot:COSAG04_NODE_2086_length_4830_cov_2.263581_2_plen_204_part_00
MSRALSELTELAQCVAERLQAPSADVQTKVLRVTGLLIQRGNLEFNERLVHEAAEQLRASASFTAPPHPRFGSKPQEMVRSSAKKVLLDLGVEVADEPTPEPEPEPEPEPQPQPEPQPELYAEPEVVEVEFAQPGPLGIGFDEPSGRRGVTVGAIVAGSAAAQVGGLRIGAAVVSIAAEGTTLDVEGAPDKRCCACCSATRGR